MNFFRLTAAVCALWLSCWGMLSSTAQAADAVLTYSEAMTRALGVDQNLAALAESRRAEELLAPTQAELPDPALSVGLQNVPLDNFSMTRLPTTMLGVTLSQTVPAPALLRARAEKTEAAATTTGAEQALAAQTLRRTVGEDWLAVFAAEQRIALLQAEQELYERLSQSAQTAYSAGRSAASDWVGLSVRKAEIADQIEAAQGSAAQARARLARWLGAAVNRPWPRRLPNELRQMPAGEWMAQPELAVLRGRLAQARAGVSEAKAAFEPEFGVSLGYGIKAGSMPNTASVGLSLSLPIFTGARQTPRLAAARAQADATQLALDDRAAQIHARMQAARATEASLNTRLSTYDRRILPELKRIAALAQNQFGSGGGDFSAVIQAEQALIAAKQARLDLTIDRARSLLVLNYLLEQTP